MYLHFIEMLWALHRFTEVKVWWSVMLKNDDFAVLNEQLEHRRTLTEL